MKIPHSIILMIVATLLITACVPRLKVSSLLPDVVQVASTTDNPSAPTTVIEDKHYIQTDDFFVSEIPLTDQHYVYVGVAKMIVAPSEESNQQAKFKLTRSDSVIWTQHYHKTRIASKDDLKVGKEVIFFRGTDAEGNYRAPLDADEAHNGDWRLSKIQDLGSLSQGIVTVSGGDRIKRDNIRVIN